MSLAFKGYFDTTLDVERDMAKRLIGPDPLSVEETEAHSLGKRRTYGARPDVWCWYHVCYSKLDLAVLMACVLFPI